MTLPSSLLGLMCAILIGLIFHVCVDGGVWRLLLYATLSIAGFAVGQLVGNWQGWSVLPVGPLNLGLAVAGSLLFLGLGHWLSLIQPRRPRRDDKP